MKPSERINQIALEMIQPSLALGMIPSLELTYQKAIVQYLDEQAEKGEGE